MKIKLTPVLIALLFSFSGYSQNFLTQYFDGEDTTASSAILIHMDTSSSNVWQVGMPQKTIFHRAATLPNALVTDTVDPYPPNNVSRFQFGVSTDLLPLGILALQWMQKLDLDSSRDGGIIEFSLDSGETWQNVFNNPYVYNFYGFDLANADTLENGEYAFSGRDTAWKNIWLCFDTYWLISQSSSIQIRFTLQSDSVDDNREGWMIDNLLANITGVHTISEKKKERYMTISPNPTKGRINITSEKLDKHHIIETMQLVDMEGKIVQEWKDSPTKFYIDIGHHPAGIYYLNVTTNIKSETFKVVLEK